MKSLTVTIKHDTAHQYFYYSHCFFVLAITLLLIDPTYNVTIQSVSKMRFEKFP